MNQFEEKATYISRRIQGHVRKIIGPIPKPPPLSGAGHKYSNGSGVGRLM